MRYTNCCVDCSDCCTISTCFVHCCANWIGRKLLAVLALHE